MKRNTHRDTHETYETQTMTSRNWNSHDLIHFTNIKRFDLTCPDVNILNIRLTVYSIRAFATWPKKWKALYCCSNKEQEAEHDRSGYLLLLACHYFHSNCEKWQGRKL